MLAGAASATVMIFENTAGGPLSSLDFDGQGTNYGDRVTGTTQDGFRYGDAFGWTPNVTATYSTTGVGVAGGWATGFGSLVNVIWSAGSEWWSNTETYTITLTADPGFYVALHGFKGATWTDVPPPIPDVWIRDGDGNLLWRYRNESNAQWGNLYQKDFAQPLVASQLSIQVYQGWWHALDDVAYSQQVVPEPATLSALGVAVFGLMASRRRRRHL